MSGLLETILKSGNGAAVQQLARSYGVSGDDALQAVAHLMPALNRGVRTNISSAEGLESLLNALRQGNHQQYLEQPERLAEQHTIDEGNHILGHILGSRDASRQVASQAAAQTGLDADLLKKMLPAVAALLMGGLSKQGASLGAAAPRGAAGQPESGGIGAMLGDMLDADNDGSVMDDLLAVWCGYSRPPFSGIVRRSFCAQ